MRLLIGILMLGALCAPPQASAGEHKPWQNVLAANPSAAGPVFSSVKFETAGAEAPRSAPFRALFADAAQSPAPRPAFEYSEGYKARAKIHRYASFASLPLFATEALLGESVYNNSSEGNRGAHVAIGTAIGALFAVNTVTGAWNLWEARKDPHGRTRRVLHGLLMMAADAGFVATAALAPGGEGGERGREREDDEGFGSSGRRGAHRAVALASLGIATAGYLTMIIGGR